MPGHEHVARIDSVEKCDQLQIGRTVRREIFGGVDGSIDHTTTNRLFQCRGKNPASANHCQWGRFIDVPIRTDDDRFGGNLGMRVDERCDRKIGLGER